MVRTICSSLLTLLVPMLFYIADSDTFDHTGQPLMVCTHVCGRLAESDDPVLFATYGEVDKCEFIKVNAPMGAWEAWSSTDDGAGLLLKAHALREQARAALVSAAR